MRKLLTCFVTFLVLMCIFNVNVFAEEGTQSNTKKVTEDTIIPIPASFITPDSISSGKDASIGADVYNPADDNSNPNNGRYIPQKKTDDFGISWAAAVCRTAESNYRRNTGDVSIDLSEMHLAWFSYHTDGVEDELGNIKNSGTTTTVAGSNVFNIGGNPIMATFSVANGIGFVDESKFPYKSSYTQEELNQYTKKENCYNPDYRLIKSQWYALNNDLERKNVKYYIYSNTQIATYIHLDENMINSNDKFVYYYCGDEITDKNKPNYGATIIGWNDKITADYFVSTKDGSNPEHDGAWIVQCNYKDENDKSNPQIIFISYDEASIAESFAASFEIEKIADSKELHTFQYDGNSGFNYATGYEIFNNEKENYKYETYFYNVYEPKMQEGVDSIGIYTYQPNLYINMYVSVFDAYYNPTVEEIIENSGLPPINNKGTIPRAGFRRYQVTLDGYPMGYQGKKIYVLIKLSSNDSQIKIPLDGKTTNDANYINTYKIMQKSYDSSSADNVQSYVKTNNGVKSLLEVEGAPARIKLYTKPTKNSIYYVVDDGVTNPNTLEYFDEDVIGQKILPASKDGYEFYGWFTDESFESEKLTHYPFEIEGDLYLYPAFCQKIKFDYDDNKDDIILNIKNYDNNGNALELDLPTNKVKGPANSEFAGWEYTDKEGTKVQITDFFAPYKFPDAKLNGEDIVCTPIWKTVKSNLPTSVVNENLVDNQVVFLTPDKYSPDETNLFSVNGNDLKNKIQTNTDTALIWLESKEVDDTKLKDYKDYFAKNNDKEAVAVFDINVFKQEKNETEGTKVQELTDTIYMELDVSNNPDLLKAAESNNLLVSQIHNGEATTPVQVEYNSETKKIKFPVDKFSIFAFELKEPIESPNPSGESDNTDKSSDTEKTDDTDKSSKTKTDTNTNDSNNSNNAAKSTTDPNFKPPNTGIY